MPLVCKTLGGSKNRPCRSSIAGIRSIGFAVYNPLNRVVTTPTGVIALATKYAASTITRFEVRSTTSKYLENAIKGSDTNGKNIKGTTTLTLSVPPDATERLEYAEIVDTLMDRTWVLFLELKDGSILVAGSQNGAEVLLSDSDTGATGSDLNGFMVTITTDEADFSSKYVLSGAGLTDYAAALKAVV